MKRTIWLALGGVALLVTVAAASEELKPANLAYQGRPAVNVPLVEQAPIVDGKLDDAAWAKAPVLPIHAYITGEGNVRNRSEARICSTKEALYISVRCFDTNASKLLAKARPRDGAIWEDDAIEIFLMPGEDPETPYAQLSINATGAIYDSYNVVRGGMPVAANARWNAGHLQAATGAAENAWTLEAIIPFSDLQLPKTKEELAKGWRFDITRNRPGRDNEDEEESAWVPTEEKYSNTPGMFGFLFFEAFGGQCPDAAKQEIPPAFVKKPAVVNEGARVRIDFSVNRITDVAVCVEDAQSNIVRHLAAGVLGCNAPAPLVPDALEQSLRWDRKDDLGREVAQADLRVRVSLNLHPAFDKLIGNDPADVGRIAAISVGPDGELFVFHQYGEHHHGDNSTACAVFSRDGLYRRTISPYPAETPDEKLVGVKRVTRDDGAKVPFIYHVETRAHLPGLGNIPEQKPVVTHDGRVAFVGLREILENSEHAGEAWITVVNTNGSMPEHGVLNTRLAPFLNSGAALALSPDEKTVYVTGLWVGEAEAGRRAQVSKWPKNAVYRFGWEDRNLRVFAGNEARRGDGEAEFNAPQSVAVDRDGNVYVADRGNDRISIFRPDGTPLKRIPVKRPQLVEVHRKTGAIYVMSGTGRATVLAKLEGCNTAREVARIALPSDGLMALDDTGTSVVVWLRLQDGRLCRLEETNGQFGELRNATLKSAWSRPNPMGPRSIASVHELSVDRKNGWLYISNAWRYRMRDNAWEALPHPIGVNPQWPVCDPDSTTGSAGLDGNYYMNFGGRGNAIMRFGQDLKESPFPAGNTVAISLQHEDGPSTQKTGVIGLPTRIHGQGMTTDASGNVYTLCRKKRRESGDYYRATALYVYDKNGHILKEELINTSIPGVFSIRVDDAGNLYLAAGLRKGDAGVPAGLKGQIPDGERDVDADSGINGYPLMYGSILKFGPEGGRIADQIGGVKCNFGHGQSIEVAGARWICSEASSVPSWATPDGTYNICRCDPACFDVDGFGRSFFADAGRCRVGVLDTNGNLIRWFGTYGNADSSTAEHAQEIGLCWPQAVAVGDRAAYVSDRLNRRIVAVNLDYTATETAWIPAR